MWENSGDGEVLARFSCKREPCLLQLQHFKYFAFLYCPPLFICIKFQTDLFSILFNNKIHIPKRHWLQVFESVVLALCEVLLGSGRKTSSKQLLVASHPKWTKPPNSKGSIPSGWISA